MLCSFEELSLQCRCDSVCLYILDHLHDDFYASIYDLLAKFLCGTYRVSGIVVRVAGVPPDTRAKLAYSEVVENLS